MKLTKNKSILFYKLLEVIILLTLFVWGVALLTDSILPGFISGHLSFLKLVIFASVALILLSFLGNKLNLSYKMKTKKWPVITLAIFSAVIISLSLFKFHWIEILIITITSLIIIYYFYKVLFEE